MEGRSFYYFITELFPGWKSTERSEIRRPIETNKTYSQAWFVSTGSQYFKFQTTGGRRASEVWSHTKRSRHWEACSAGERKPQPPVPTPRILKQLDGCITAYGDDLVQLYNDKFPNGFLSGTWSKDKTQNFQDRETCPMVPNLLSTPASFNTPSFLPHTGYPQDSHSWHDVFVWQHPL